MDFCRRPTGHTSAGRNAWVWCQYCLLGFHDNCVGGSCDCPHHPPGPRPDEARRLGEAIGREIGEFIGHLIGGVSWVGRKRADLLR
jgi:hypothetical protein